MMCTLPFKLFEHRFYSIDSFPAAERQLSRGGGSSLFQVVEPGKLDKESTVASSQADWEQESLVNTARQISLLGNINFQQHIKYVKLDKIKVIVKVVPSFGLSPISLLLDPVYKLFTTWVEAGVTLIPLFTI